MSRRGRDDVERISRGMLPPESHPDTLTDGVRQALRRDILSLVLAPGAHLSIRDLHTRYAVGATPIREALWHLVGAGLVETEAQHGFKVADATRDNLLSIMALRQQVEPWALAVAMRSGGPNWRRTLEAAFLAFHQKDSKVGDQRPMDTQWEELHRNFHLSLIQGCGMPILLRAVAGWHEQTDRYRRLASPHLGYTVAAMTDHEILYEAARASDVEMAMGTLHRHIGDTMTRHLGYFDAPAASAR
jgi:GntR family carbon starvation induced transcriptional regulator